MLKCLLGGDSFSRIIDKYFLEKVEKVSAELVVVWDDFLLSISLYSPYCLHKNDLHLTAS